MILKLYELLHSDGHVTRHEGQLGPGKCREGRFYGQVKRCEGWLGSGLGLV